MRKLNGPIVLFLYTVVGCASSKPMVVEKTRVEQKAPLPSAETLKEFIKRMERRTIACSAEDQDGIETILRIIARADRVELRQILKERRVFPIQDKQLRTFWHVVLITAYVLKSNPTCEERAAYWREEISGWPVPQRNLFLAAEYFLVGRHYQKKYLCLEGPDGGQQQLVGDGIASRSAPFDLLDELQALVQKL